jgi:uncharacterized cupredoxin-like copper-binding protein
MRTERRLRWLCAAWSGATEEKELVSMKLHYFLLGLGGAGAVWAGTAGAARSVTTVKVIAGKPSEFRFVVPKKALLHGTVTFRMTNGGLIPHDLKICASPKGGLANSCAGKGTKLISPGQSTDLTYTFKTKGTYEYLCTVPGHAAAGMKGDLKVT